MRHYLWHDAAGTFGGPASHVHTNPDGSRVGGYPPELDLASPRPCREDDPVCRPHLRRTCAACGRTFVVPPRDAGAEISCCSGPCRKRLRLDACGDCGNERPLPPPPPPPKEGERPEEGQKDGERPAAAPELPKPPTCTHEQRAVVAAPPECFHEFARRMREDHRAAYPTLVGFVPFDCPCPSSAVQCSCARKAVESSRLENGRIVRKPGALGAGLDVLLDGSPQNALTPVAPYPAAPGASVRLQLRAPGVPDGHRVRLGVGGSVRIASPTTLTFKGGVTEEFVLRAPAQGLVGGAGGESTREVESFAVWLLGWAP